MKLRKLIAQLDNLGRGPEVQGVRLSRVASEDRLLRLLRSKTVLTNDRDIHLLLSFGLEVEPHLRACYSAFFSGSPVARGDGLGSVTVLGGGRGGRTITRGFLATGAHVRTIISAYGDRRRAGPLRDFSDMLDPSDIRESHCTLLFRGTSQQRALRRFLSCRLQSSTQWKQILGRISTMATQNGDRSEEEPEKAYRLLDLEKQTLLRTYLASFNMELQRGEPPRFCGLSLGDCVYVGAYLHYGRDLLLAIRWIEKTLLDLDLTGQVLPVSTNNLWLAAITSAGEVVPSDAYVVQTVIDDDIEAVYLLDKPLNGKKQALLASAPDKDSKKQYLLRWSASPRPTLEALAAVAASDIVVHAPGTLHASLLPTYLTPSLPQALRWSSATRAFLTNLRHDSECRTVRASDYVARTSALLQGASRSPGAFSEYFDYVLVNTLTPHTSEGGAWSRVVEPDMRRLRSFGVEPIARNLEEPRLPGIHNGRLVREYIMQLRALKLAGFVVKEGRLAPVSCPLAHEGRRIAN